MSNDTSHLLQIRHPKKARLVQIKTYLTEIKPAIYQLVQQMKFDRRWPEDERLPYPQFQVCDSLQ
ncbi:MAG: hypothetical protein K9M97_02780 [Akkermansiaceae bacterium]|nr:hypothetical protein [Akkermansiaceae bacterium]